MDKSAESAWKSIECKHAIGIEIKQYKKDHPSSKSTELLEQVAEQIGHDVNYKFLQLCEKFARRFPDYESFKVKYSDEILEPFAREPSWTYIQENFLFEKRTIELATDETVTIEEGEDDEGHHYRRAVINLIPLDQKMRFEELYTRAAQKHKILPSNYLRGCGYGLWSLFTDGMINEIQLEQIKTELTNRKEQAREWNF